jgi:hypothetical protein
LHGGDTQVLDIACHNPVHGHLGHTGLICNGLVLPFQIISAKVTPFTPTLNGHGKEVGTVTGLTDLGAAYANVIWLLFQGLR